LKKNTATKWIVFAFDRTNNTPKTGDAANITANVRIDGGGANAVDDTNPAELEDGYYIFDITAAECNGDLIVICPASSTADIQVIGVPGAVWTDTLSAEIAVVDGIVDDILVDTGTDIPALISDLPSLAEIEASAVLAKASQLVAISGGLTISSFPSSSTVIQGTETLTVAALTADDDSEYVVTDAGTGIDFILKTSPYDGAAIPATVHFHGYYDEDSGATNSCSVMAYNFELSQEQGTDIWDVLHVLTNAVSDQANDLALGGPHRAPAAGTFATVVCAKGDVLIRFFETTPETGSDVFLDHFAVGFAGHSITLEEIEASTVLAKVSDIETISEDIADLVWDEPLVGHITADSSGLALQIARDAAPGAGGVTPAEVADAVWAKVVTGAISAETALATLYNGWTSDAGAGSGAGAIVSVITVNVSASPEDGVEVWVSTDIEGTNVVAGTLTTDAFGQVTFMLDAGTYFLWKQKAGVNFTNPEEIVVTAP
jgi:hypothetical protein